jgi:hypothetical protein
VTGPSRTTVAALAGWAALIGAARLVGLWHFDGRLRPLNIRGVPFVGTWEPWITDALWAPIAVAALGVALLPRIAARWAWPAVLAATASVQAAFAAALAWSGRPFEHWQSIELSYGRHTDLVATLGPGGLLSSYVDRQPDLPGHLRAHPPGLLLVLRSLESVGAQGTGWQLALVLVAGAASAVAAVVALRAVAGEGPARAAAPFVAIVPAAVFGTNADVVFGAAGLVAVALGVVATARSGRRADALAVAGGAAFAAALLGSYGVALLGVAVAVAAGATRAWRVLALWCGAAGACLAAVGLAWGFWWPAGLWQTHDEYRHSLARSRGYAYWLLGNPAVFAVLIGPAVVVGLTRLRGRPWVVVGGGLAAVAVAALSGMSSAETERIWQPFVPLVALGAAGLALGRDGARPGRVRPWLALQATVAIGLTAVLRSPW